MAGTYHDSDLPEYFEKRQGGAMDLAAVAKKATPGLIDEIASRFPSFPQQWIDDRTRILAGRIVASAIERTIIVDRIAIQISSLYHVDRNPDVQVTLGAIIHPSRRTFFARGSHTPCSTNRCR